jgi:rare lipoprotein A (peptidoglycan hydrolase)
MKTPRTAISLRRFSSGFRPVALIGILALSGCVTEQLQEQDPLPPQAKTSAPSTKPVYREIGKASWYGPGFQGNKTANGEIFNQNKLTAAHRRLPLGTKAEVTNLENGRKVEVKINDRGPYVKNRSIDLSRAAAKKLDMQEDGIARVKIEVKSNQSAAFDKISQRD